MKTQMELKLFNQQLKCRELKQGKINLMRKKVKMQMVRLYRGVKKSRPTVSEVFEENCGRSVEVERLKVMCTLETDSIGDKSEDHSFVSQIEEEGSGHGMEEGDDDDNMSEMSDIPSRCGNEQFYTVKEINDFLNETFGRKFEVREFFPDVKKFLISVMKIQEFSRF